MVVVGTPVMRDPKYDERPKLRRFALIIGLILFTYSIAGVQLRAPAEMNPLGIPLVVLRPWLLDVGLLLAFVWAVVRFWYYGMVLELTAMRARQRLRRGILSDGTTGSGGHPSAFFQQFQIAAHRYFPTVRKSQIRVEETPDKKPVISHIPYTTRFLLVPIENLDFLLPAGQCRGLDCIRRSHLDSNAVRPIR